MIQWYTIQLLPQFQKTADFNLRRQNFIPFFPRVLVRKSKTEQYFEPLFKGYGFVSFDVEKDQWRSVNGTRGVVSLLPKWTLMPKPMKDGFVEYFIEKDPIESKEFEDVFEQFYPGVLIEVTKGLLQGRRGYVIEVRSKLLEIALYSNDKSYYNVLISKDEVSSI